MLTFTSALSGERCAHTRQHSPICACKLTFLTITRSEPLFRLSIFQELICTCEKSRMAEQHGRATQSFTYLVRPSTALVAKPLPEPCYRAGSLQEHHGRAGMYTMASQPRAHDTACNMAFRLSLFMHSPYGPIFVHACEQHCSSPLCRSQRRWRAPACSKMYTPV